MEREGAASGWLLVGEVPLKKKLECQDLGEGQSKGPEVGVSLMCLRTHEETGVAAAGGAGEMARDRWEGHSRVLGAIQAAVTPDDISVTKMHPKDVSARSLLPYSDLFSNLQDLLQTQPRAPETSAATGYLMPVLNAPGSMMALQPGSATS